MIKCQFEFEVFFRSEGGHVNDVQSAYKFKPVHVITCKELCQNVENTLSKEIRPCHIHCHCITPKLEHIVKLYNNYYCCLHKNSKNVVELNFLTRQQP